MAEPLRAKLAVLEEQQGGSAEETGLMKAAMAGLMAKVTAAQATLAALQVGKTARRVKQPTKSFLHSSEQACCPTCLSRSALSLQYREG